MLTILNRIHTDERLIRVGDDLNQYRTVEYAIVQRVDASVRNFIADTSGYFPSPGGSMRKLTSNLGLFK